jgi:hypothetical protein
MRFRFGVLVLVLIDCGCDSSPPASPPGQPAAVPSANNHPTAGLTGRVVWSGAVPQIPPVSTMRPAPNGSTALVTRPAPNAPVIGPDGGVAGAVVYLRGVDPAKARPWDRPPVVVEMHDARPMLRQGDGPPTNLGFVHAGDEITVVSRQHHFHALRARGAAFWTLALPDPDRPRIRRLTEPGVVELCSGAYEFWMRAYLWVCDHPYYAPTDAAGQWTLTEVPAGEYELVVWLPDWRTARQERDPETGLVVRYVFRPPLQTTRRVTVQDGESIGVGDVPISP